MIKKIAMTAFLLMAAFSGAIIYWGYDVKNLGYFGGKRNVCIEQLSIIFPEAVNIVYLYNKNSDIFYHRGWWPSMGKGELSRSEVTLGTISGEAISIYPNYGREISRSCHERQECRIEEKSLFGVRGEYFYFENLGFFFYISEKNALVYYSSPSLGELGGVKIDGQCI